MTLPPLPSSKRSWPLVAFAVTSFIPVLGFFLAAAAVSWGLLSDRPRAKLAVVIGGAGALFQVAGGALLLMILMDKPVVRAAWGVATSKDLNRVVVELEAYRGRVGGYPVSLQQLVSSPIPWENVSIIDMSGSLTRQQPYQYHPARDGQSHRLFAVGEDGEPGTGDDIYPSQPDPFPPPAPVPAE